MNQIIVVGNIYDDTNEFCSNGRVYSGGGIAPTIGASNFAREKYVLEIYRLVATFGDFNENNNKCVLSNT